MSNSRERQYEETIMQNLRKTVPNLVLDAAPATGAHKIMRLYIFLTE
jgi:hypothetical protein